MRHKGDVCWIEVPSRREFAVDVRLVKPFSGSAVLPDPAVAQRDIAVAKDAGGKIALTVTVHNLGNAAVEDLTIALARGDRDKYSEIARQRIDLPGCEDLRPCRMDVKFSGVNSAAGLMVLLDPQEKVSEIYELNNRVNVPDSAQ